MISSRYTYRTGPAVGWVGGTDRSGQGLRDGRRGPVSVSEPSAPPGLNESSSVVACASA